MTRPTTSTVSPGADVQRPRIAALKAELGQMEGKRQRLVAAITLKRQVLSRLEARAAIAGSPADRAPTPNG